MNEDLNEFYGVFREWDFQECLLKYNHQFPEREKQEELLIKKKQLDSLPEKERTKMMIEKFKNFKIIWLINHLDLLATNRAIMNP